MKTMKRPVMKIISIALATRRLTATAASAPPRNTGNYRAAQTHNNNGTAVALGFGLFALGALAIIASQNNRDNERYDNRYYAPPRQYGNGNYGPSPYGQSYYGSPSYSPVPYGQTSYGPPADYYDGRSNSGYDG